MASGHWVYAGEEADMPDNVPVMVSPNGIAILAVRKGSETFAVSNECAHMECSLAEGHLDGYTLQCSCHDWRYDIRTGTFLDAPEISLQVYESRMTDGRLYIKLSGATATEVFLYTLSTCPWCAKAKRFMTQQGVDFDYVDYDLADEAEQDRILGEIEKIGGARSFPLAKIGDEIIVGYNPARYTDLLGLKA